MKALITQRIQKPDVFTFATLPAAANANVGFAYISDFGINGSLWYNTGSAWKLIGKATFLEDDTGYIVPGLITGNAATYSQTGNTVTVTSTGHNIPATVHNGKNVYLAIGTVSTGVAPTGYSTGWFSNFQYVDANTFTCTATNSQSGTGAVNTNTSAITLPISYSLPAGVMGLTGRIELQAITSHNNSAGAKTFQQLFAGNAWSSTAPTTTISSYILKSIKNKGSASVQSAPSASVFSGNASSAANGAYAINTANAVSLTFRLFVAAASDYAALDWVTLSLYSN